MAVLQEPETAILVLNLRIWSRIKLLPLWSRFHLFFSHRRYSIRGSRLGEWFPRNNNDKASGDLVAWFVIVNSSVLCLSFFLLSFLQYYFRKCKHTVNSMVKWQYQRLPFTDTENEVTDDDLDQDYEIILKRLTKLEKVCQTMACHVLFDL